MTIKICYRNLAGKKGFEISSILFLCLLPLYNTAQNMTSSFVQVFPKESYGYGTQNWQVLQAQDGLLLFANNDGLLSYDGYEWDLFPLSNKTILRSILEKDGKIYAGGQNELGYFKKDLKANWSYHSLKSLLPNQHQGFEDVWTIVEKDEVLYFHSSNKVFLLQNNVFKVWDQQEFLFLGKAGEKIFLHTSDGSLFTVEPSGLQVFYQAELLKEVEIRSIIPYRGSYLIATLKRGIFELKEGQLTSWELPNLPIKQPFSISRVDQLPDGKLAIASSYNGLILWNDENNSPTLLSSNNELPSDGVLSTCLDNSGNLWLGLENGLALIELSTPIKRVNLVKRGYGIAYDVVTWRGNLFVGTNSGLYKATWPNQFLQNHLELIPGSAGQVWGCQVIDDRLFMNHADGLFESINGKAVPVNQAESSWLIKPYKQNSYMLGTYQGIYLSDRQSALDFRPIHGLEESSRFLEFDVEGNIWMSHPYRGVFKIGSPGKNEEQVRLLGKDQGLPSNLHNHVFKINNQVLIAAEKGLFHYDNSTDTFQPLVDLNQYFNPEEKIRRLLEAPNGDIWFITESEIGYLEVKEFGLNKEITKHILPNLKRFMNGGWEKIFPVDAQNIFITSVNGLLYINLGEVQTKKSRYPIRLNAIQINKDSTFYPHAQEGPIQFSPKENDLSFEVSAINFAYNENIKYEYFLEGYDKDWTAPDFSRIKEYTNLPYQKYTLKVRAVDPNQEVSIPYSLTFEILKPWYLSMAAKMIYTVVAIFLASFFTRMVMKRFRALENEMADTVKQSKEEIRRLENERIQAELDHKKRELVSTTIHITKKNETLQDLTAQLNRLKREIKDPQTNKKLQKIIHFLKTEDRVDEGWDQLLYHFNELHPSFFDKLKKEHSSLTPKDLKLCAYLKMNLSTKEIANLMNVSVRGIEASRYRLRKRLDLPTDTNLNTFFMNY